MMSARLSYEAGIQTNYTVTEESRFFFLISKGNSSVQDIRGEISIGLISEGYN